MSGTAFDGQVPGFAEITLALGRGDRAGALDLSFAALLKIADPEVLRRVTAGLTQELGRPVSAAAAPELWRRYGGSLARAAGRLVEAQAALEVALALEPDVPHARMDAGTVAYMRADLAVARTHFERAAALRPSDPEPLASLAALAARQERFGEARALGERALALRPDLLSAHLAVARADLHENRAVQAEARLTQLLAGTALADAQRVGVLDLRADVRDALARTADAFADYSLRNVILARINAPRIATELQERRIDQARRLASWFGHAPPESWQERAAPDSIRRVRAHVFLLGFPRSGTTLLEKALAGHPDITTLEEIDLLAGPANRLLASDTGLRTLAVLTDSEADAHRGAYWRGAEAAAGRPLTGRILLDKLPLHTIALPLIAKLFPDAQVLFALRDPRDVVLSCFRRRFRVNSAMFEFLTLEGAARYYDAVMSLARRYRTLLPLDVHEVRHEAMVADFDGELRTALAFMGADWHPAVRAFAERARARPGTPSDLQLARGLNAEGVGQWRRYESSLAPVLGVLAPWVAHFGYSP